MPATAAPFPPQLLAPGVEAGTGTYQPLLAVHELPEGAMRRVTRGDLDVLLAHTSAGIVATDDRCPHMSAPLSIGELDGCIVACPLHEGRRAPEEERVWRQSVVGASRPVRPAAFAAAIAWAAAGASFEDRSGISLIAIAATAAAMAPPTPSQNVWPTARLNAP